MKHQRPKASGDPNMSASNMRNVNSDEKRGDQVGNYPDQFDRAAAVVHHPQPDRGAPDRGATRRKATHLCGEALSPGHIAIVIQTLPTRHPGREP